MTATRLIDNGDANITDCAATIGKFVIHGSWGIVYAGDAQSHRRDGFRSVIVRHGVGEFDRSRLAFGQILIIGPRIVNHLVVDDGGTAATRGNRNGVYGVGVTEINVGVIGQNVDGHRRVFVRTARIGNGYRTVIGAGNGQADGGGRFRPVIVRHGVGQRDGCRLADGQVLIIRSRIVNHLIAVDHCRAAARGDGHGINRMGVTEIDVGIVRQNVDGHRRVFVRAAAIGHGDGAVVRAGDDQ